jgi:hypothetical protein
MPLTGDSLNRQLIQLLGTADRVFNQLYLSVLLLLERVRLFIKRVLLFVDGVFSLIVL